MNILAKNRLLEWVIGDDPGRAGTPQLQWTNLPESWGVFVLLTMIVAIAFGVFWLYRREINTCPMPLKLVLGGLRLAVLLLLIAMFLKPSVFYQQVNEIKPTIAMLRDSSLSFDRGDRYRSQDQVNRLSKISGFSSEQIGSGEVKRSQLVNQIFLNNPELLSELRNKGALRVVDFSDGNRPVVRIPATLKTENVVGSDVAQPSDSEESAELPDSLLQVTLPELVAAGLGTDIWQALKETLDDPARNFCHSVDQRWATQRQRRPGRIGEAGGLPGFADLRGWCRRS